MSSNEMKESGKSLNVFMSSKGPVFDDVDAAFDAAATTASPAASIANESTKPLTNDKGKSRKDVRFSLESKSVTVGTETLASLGVTTVTSRSRSLIDTDRLSLSPSDISRASTAPPKPLEKDTLEEEAEELEDEKEAEDEEPIVADPSNDEQAAPLRTNQPDDEDKYGGDFLDNQDDDDDDDDEDDELLPPPPPDSPEPQRPDEDDAAIVASSSPTDFPNADDDEDGEEDQDGFGYEMANNEEGAVTPAQKSAKANNKDKRSKKRDPSDGSEDENSEDGTRQFTVDAKNKKKKKSKKREVDESEEKTPMPRKKAKRLKAAAYVPGTVFPKGIAMPYEYTSVPVSNFKDYDHDGKAVRRSQRARIPPLEFWKGEKVTWGPCEEFDDPLFDSVANMPVPIAIEQAQPTPYKQRKVPTTKKKHPEKGMDSSKKSHKNGHGVVEMEPFDNTKIRKKYPGMVFDSDEAYLWDEATEESTDLSKNFRLMTSLALLAGLHRCSLTLLRSFCFKQRCLDTRIPFPREHSRWEVADKLPKGRSSAERRKHLTFQTLILLVLDISWAI
ncbi:hypothetical protein MPSEU_000478800 [Mayamaea pseudoterrestris]|nr:hypothetical protein MPSEU_000478800 [Mayamaea pseudoterrestris]